MTDIREAFSFPFREKDWGEKFLVAALFVLLSLTGIGMFVLAGYFVQVTQRVMRGETQLLPDWKDIGVMFVTGFKLILVLFLYALPMLALFVPFVVLASLSEMTDNQGALALLAVIYFFGYLVVALPYGLLLTIAYPIIQFRFARRERMADALDLAAVARFLRQHWESTLIVALIGAGIQMLAGIGVVFFLVGVAFTAFYAYVVTAYLSGRLALEDEPVPLERM